MHWKYRNLTGAQFSVKCEDCLSKPGSSNEDIIRGTGGASEESHDVNDPHDSNDHGQSDAHNNEETKDKEEVEGRMCECK